MNAASPIARSIPDYLEQLRAALAGADPALIQDALYDAEDYLRSEWAEHPQLDEASLLASVAGSYGAPSEVADIYRETEVTVNQALRVPAPRAHMPPSSVGGRRRRWRRRAVARRRRCPVRSRGPGRRPR